MNSQKTAILIIAIIVSLVIFIMMLRLRAPEPTIKPTTNAVSSSNAPIVSQQVSPLDAENNAGIAPKNGKIFNVRIADFMFNPAVVEISKGDKVIWTNGDDQTHIIASDKLPQNGYLPKLISPQIEKNQTFEFVFENEGTFGYHCQLHPSMKAVIKVK